jgi:ATP-binding cassette subfamily B protein
MTSPASPRRGCAGRLIGYCWHKPVLLLAALAGMLLGTAATVAIPLIQRDIVNNAILAHHQSVRTGAAALMIAATLNFTGFWARRYLGGRLALEVQHDLRTEMFTSLSRLDGPKQDELNTGQIVGRSTSDLTLVQGLLVVVPAMLGIGLLSLGSLAAMLVLSPRLTVAAAAAGVSLFGVTAFSRGKMFAASWAAQQGAARVAAAVNDAVAGVRVVKGFGQEDRETARVAEASRLLYAARVRVTRLMARYNPVLQALPALGQIGVLAYGGYLAIHGQISLGTLLAFASYIVQLVPLLKAAAGLIPLAQEARASAIRVFDVIDSRPAVVEQPGAVILPSGTHDIHLDNVTFGYQPAEPVLRGLSLLVGAGETVAIAGAPGSGKSTVGWLLARFYDVTSGAIRIGGHDVRDLTIDSLRASIGLVMEESFLFAGTIKDNIRYGRPDATDGQIIAAVRAAGADEFISEMPDGYDTVLGEQGMTLSGGQRQRLALARTLVTDPAILVLDDATSAVDPQLEAQIHAALRQGTEPRTTLVIARRLPTLQLADKIAVLDVGRLVDVGTHHELITRCPQYRLLLTGPEDQAGDCDGEELAWLLTRSRRRYPWPQPERRYRHARRRPGPHITFRGAGRRADGTVGGGHPGWRRAGSPPDTLTLGRLLRPFAVALIAGLILDGLDVIAGLAVPSLMRSGIDHGIQAADLGYIIAVSAVALAIVLADWGVNAAQIMILGRNGERMLHTLRVRIFSHLQRLGLDFYEREMGGRIMTRMTTDIDAMSAFLQTGLITMINSGLTLIGVMIAVLLINVKLGLVLLGMLPVLVVATAVFRVKATAANREARERISAVNADLQENIAGLRVIQAFRQEKGSIDAFRRLSRGFVTARTRAQLCIALYFPFVQALAVIAGALVLLVAAGEVRDGTLTTGSLIAYLLYIDLLFSPVQEISQVFDGWQQASVGVGRLAALLKIPVSTPDAERPVPPGRLRGEIEFADVCFSYPEAAKPAVAGINLRIAPGETVALVGRTGAGKSTLVKLVARFYDVTAGTILIDGVDVRNYDLGGYRRQLGMVPQELYLFPGTVRDAIAYGRPDATQTEVETAARGVGASGMIARLPGGLTHAVAERGRNLSIGEGQLIALARAYLVDPAILLIDEATAALYPAAEAEVARAIEKLAAHRTTLIVAHGLTTASRADRIIVVDSGRIAEVGTHGELLAAAGLYADMWAAWLGHAMAS